MISGDNYIDVMSSHDYALRMNVTNINGSIKQSINRDDFIKYICNHILAWEESEKRDVLKTIMDIVLILQKLNFNGKMPDMINIVKTDGLEELHEFNLCYARKKTICVSTNGIRRLCHKSFINALFNIFLQNDDKLRDKMYNSIGFHICNDINLPTNLIHKTIIHPGSYHRDAYIDVAINGSLALSKMFVIPIMMYKGACNKFLRVISDRYGMFVPYRVPYIDPIVKKCILYDVEDLDMTDFYNRTGDIKNLFHPNEILADRFSKIVLSAMWSMDLNNWYHTNTNTHEQTMKELLFDIDMLNIVQNTMQGIVENTMQSSKVESNTNKLFKCLH
jgi:hypothetical protein